MPLNAKFALLPFKQIPDLSNNHAQFDKGSNAEATTKIYSVESETRLSGQSLTTAALSYRISAPKLSSKKGVRK